MRGQIVAIGGGGFTCEKDRLAIDHYLLELTNKERPHVLFLPQASAEAKDYVEAYLTAYRQLGADADWLSLYGSVEHGWEERILKADLVYVGGGNTRSMLALWREWGVDQLLRQAAEQGSVLAGVSAGAICWFEQGITDSVRPLGVLDCLGFLPGSCCPHYDGEPERRPAYAKFLLEQRCEPGIALSDGTAAHYVDGKLHQTLVWREGRAYSLDGDAKETELPALQIIASDACSQRV